MYLFFTIILGLAIGSFLNVCIYRIPRGESVSFPASHCPNCNNKIKWYDNIPVLSYIMLGGKCRKCKNKISIRYTIVEILTSVLYVFCYFAFFNTSISNFIISLILIPILIVVSFIDIEHKIIFDRFNIIILILGIVETAINYKTFYYNLLGFLVMGAIFFSIFYGSKALLKREGIGGGDVKLMTASGLLLGLHSLLAVLIGFVSASIILIILKAIRKDKVKEYAFAPFLCFGIFVTFLYGSEIVNWYLSMFII